MFPLSELRKQIHSIPRNPSIIKFFRYAKLGENAGYGIDKMLVWEKLTKGKVEFTSDLVSSTITYWFGDQVSDQVSGTYHFYLCSQKVFITINTFRSNVLIVMNISERIVFVMINKIQIVCINSYQRAGITFSPMK